MPDDRQLRVSDNNESYPGDEDEYEDERVKGLELQPRTESRLLKYSYTYAAMKACMGDLRVDSNNSM